jgi:hypothetical protein
VQILQITGYIASAPGFTQQSQIAMTLTSNWIRSLGVPLWLTWKQGFQGNPERPVCRARR